MGELELSLKVLGSTRHTLDAAVTRAIREANARIVTYKKMLEATASEDARQCYQFAIDGIEFVLAQIRNNLGE